MSRPSSNDAVTIRTAAPADVPAIEAVVADAYQPYVARIGCKPGPMTDDYAALVADADVFVAESAAGVIVGVVVLTTSCGRFLLHNVAVAPKLHGRGIGGQLIRFAEAYAAARGFAEVTLYTNAAMTENRAMYRALGYRQIGQRRSGGYERVFFAKRLPATGNQPLASSSDA